MKKTILKIADFFAGVGGIRLGFEKIGFETIFATDFDKNCKTTYDKNFKEPKLFLEDVWKIDIKSLPNFDIFVGGFPCQSFSIAGKRKGFNDKERGNLFFRIVDILKEKRPQVVILENVKNLKTHDDGNTFKIIKKTLEELGYSVLAEVLNSMKHGNVPQNRERIFIIGFLIKRKQMLLHFQSQYL